MPYGIIKIDTITFTDGGVDKSVSISGLVQNPTFSGNITVTGTVSGNTIQGQTVSGATITGGAAAFTTVTGGVATITSGVFALGSASNPSISFTGDANSGLYSPGADQVAISTGGSGRLFVDASGNIGVGDNAVILAAGYTSLRLNGSTGGLLELTSAGSRVLQIQSDGVSAGAQITTVTSSPLIFNTNNTERLRITSAGLVGIGTSSPSYALDISGAGGTIGCSVATNSNTLRFSNPNTTAEWAAGTSTPGIENAGNYFSIAQLGTDSTWRDRLRIDSSGRVGIGTTSPSASDWNVNSQVLHIYKNTTDGSALKVESSNAVGVFAAGSDLVAVGSISNDPLQFRVNTNEVGRFDTSGRLLVGTSPATGSRELQLASGFSANSNRSSSFAKSLSLSDNVSTTYFTIAIPSFVDFADVLSVGVEVSYVVTAHRQTSGRGATATYGKVYLAISRYWESSTVAPIVTALTTTDQALAFADQGFDPTIAWAVSQDAGTDQAAKNVYLAVTVDNTAPGTIVQRIDGTAFMNYYTTRDVVGIS